MTLTEAGRLLVDAAAAISAALRQAQAQTSPSRTSSTVRYLDGPGTGPAWSGRRCSPTRCPW
ncbi:hypothetical protein [Micromonospora sp. IBHARD004]|uniref:hypothetical protein n=1 Tax=Micromonospora sp. IBHARD004 TaxID=3457764 RepID=UPI004058C0E7